MKGEQQCEAQENTMRSSIAITFSRQKTKQEHMQRAGDGKNISSQAMRKEIVGH